MVFLAIATLLLFVGYCSPKDRHYLLSIVNDSKQQVRVNVTYYDQELVVPPQSVKSFKIRNQSNIDKTKKRKFTMSFTDGTKQEFEYNVDYSGNVIIDVTANSCFMAVDYGPQYRPESVSLGSNEADIKVKALIRNQRKIFIRPIIALEREDGKREYIPIVVELGDPLPTKIKTTRNYMPELVRFMTVPCHLVNNKVGLYNYLSTH